MDKKKINKLFLVLCNNLIMQEEKKSFFFFFQSLFLNFHFLTKLSLNFFFILIDFLSIFFFLKKFKNLSLQQGKFIVDYLLNFKIFNKIIFLVKVYSIIFIFSK
jgi:hypothetical protein